MSWPSCMTSLIARTASDGISATVRAISTERDNASPSSTTSESRPIARASEAVIASPVRTIFAARYFPIARMSRCVPPAPGMMPTLISGWPNLVLLPAMIMSHVNASSQPPPSA